MQNNDIELEPVNKGAYDPDRPRTSSVLATNFRLLGDQMKNQAMADDSRRKSRATKGLNPDAPRPAGPPKGIVLILLQVHLSTKSKPSR